MLPEVVVVELVPRSDVRAEEVVLVAGLLHVQLILEELLSNKKHK